MQSCPAIVINTYCLLNIPESFWTAVMHLNSVSVSKYRYHLPLTSQQLPPQAVACLKRAENGMMETVHCLDTLRLLNSVTTHEKQEERYTFRGAVILPRCNRGFPMYEPLKVSTAVASMRQKVMETIPNARFYNIESLPDRRSETGLFSPFILLPPLPLPINTCSSSP